MISYRSFENFPEIKAFTTTRFGGISKGNYASLNLSPYSGDETGNFQKNKAVLAEKLNISPENIIIPYQTHGCGIKEIDNDFLLLKKEQQQIYLNAVDALFTKQKKLCIAVSTADCVPIFFYDPQKSVISIAHAGWRGTCARIAENTIRSMQKCFNTDPEDLKVVLGPSISPDVYEVGRDLIDEFEKSKFDTREIFKIRDNKYYLNLWLANRFVLEQAGVPQSNIEISGICTYSESEKYFSARRMGLKSGRILSGIMINQ